MKNALKLVVFAAVLFMFSCGGDDTPAVVPTVDFTHERQVVEPGVEVAFISTHTDATSFAWDFGDGNTSTDQNPTHTYTSTGNYAVSLTVTSSTGDNAISASSVVVGDRYMAVWAVESISFTNADGNAWDEDGGPDLLYGFAAVSDGSIPLFDLGMDITEDDFPIGLRYEAIADQPLFTDENWAFILFENDEPFNQVDGSSDVMSGFEINPVTQALDDVDYETGQGVFRIAGNGYSFAFEVVFRVQ